MSTIASPRPSITLSSRRTSTSTTDTNARSESLSRVPGGQRRNRAALRDYYGLKEAAKAAEAEPKETLLNDDTAPESELDKPDFNAEEYVQKLLAREGLQGILKVEAGLLSDVRGFDGERKALVYDNYSKLIGATDTIRKMRTNMDPLAPTTSTLTPAISHIVNTADTLSASLGGSSVEGEAERLEKKEKQRRTVQWVLDAPSRLRQYKDDNEDDKAQNDWGRVQKLLDRWEGVEGVDEVRRRCAEVMQEQSSQP